MEMDWTEKYRPATLSEVYGNKKAVTALLKWAHGWNRGVPDRKAVILAGSPGIGKTSTALALGKDMDWGVIELNASDVRNAENIRNIVTRGALFETFTDTGEFIRSREGGKKLIILDEADNLYEGVRGEARTDKNGKDYSDRGGKAAIIQTIKQTMQPIILIVNDLYALTRNTNLKTLCEIIRFRKIRAPSIEKALIGIIHNEGLEVEREALEIIASRADGDLRAAINDLQALSRMGERITVEMTEGIGFRDNVITLQEALSKIFKGTDVDVRKVAWDLDETPDSILSWVDENLPLAYTAPMDLMRGYDAISRADVYLGRVRRRQYYRLWAYANDMMTAGVALAKEREYRHFIRYRFPSWILKMSRSKGMRKRRNELSRKVGEWCHTSIKDARVELLPMVQVLFKESGRRDFDFAINMTDKLGLTIEEVAFLLETVTDDPRVTFIQEKAVESHGERTGFYPSQMVTKKGLASGLETKKRRASKKEENAKKAGKGN
ncbi:MAG: replication factor C large subunit, partial [Thermoplasmata archaeon]|nr:replication factor C large subunit [Thermoplasmata archaeon]